MPSPIYTPGYRYATEYYPLDGSTIDFEFNFAGGYISQDYVLAFYRTPDRVETQLPPEYIEWIGPNQVRIADAATHDQDDILILRRDTPKDLPLVTYSNNAVLNETSLNKNTKQAIHAVAEMVDLFADMIALFNEIDISGLNFLALTDTPNTYIGQAGNIPAVASGEAGLVFKTPAQIVTEGGGGAGVSDFLGLSDTPNTFAGAGSFRVKVNPAATALEFVPEDSVEPGSFITLQDVAPHSYTGLGHKIPWVNTAETGMEFKTAAQIVAEGGGGATDFLGLSDTPNNYAGAGGYKVKVNAGATGLEFVADAGGGSYIALSDSDETSAGDYTGKLNHAPLVNAAEDGLNLKRVVPAVMTASSPTTDNGVFCDPLGTCINFPVEGDYAAQYRKTVVFGAKIEYKSTHPAYSNFNGNSIYGHSIKFKGSDSQVHGNFMNLNINGCVVMGCGINIGDTTETYSRLNASIWIGGNQNNAVTLHANNNRMIILGDFSGAGAGNDVAGYFDDVIHIGYSSTQFGSKKLKRSIALGYNSGIVSIANAENAIALGTNSVFLAPGSYNAPLVAEPQLGTEAGTDYARVSFEIRTTNDTANQLMKIGGDAALTELQISSMANGSFGGGNFQKAFAIKGTCLAKTCPVGGSQPTVDAWDFEVYLSSYSGVNIIIAQTWTNKLNPLGLSAPSAFINGSSKLSMRCTGLAATNISWSVLMKIHAMG